MERVTVMTRAALHRALSANGPKGAHLIQIPRAHAAAYLQAAASNRSGSGLPNVPALHANLKVSHLVTFSSTNPPLARALAERNYDRLTPVQTAVLADDAAGRDLLVSAQTGSGKTVAYGLAIAKNLLGDARR